jgi:DNA-binding NarL/FixJ family response regulator
MADVNPPDTEERNMRIIIVDDDKTMRTVLRSLCEGQGHVVLAEFGDGEGLLDFVQTNRPDVVCLDFNLPGADGLELLAHMDAAANHVDVIMISGSDDPEVKGHAADFGARGFIHKPFKPAQIIAELKDIEESRRIVARAAETPVPPAAAVADPEAALPALEASAPVTSGVPEPEQITGVVPRSAVVVDDSGSVRLLLKGILEELGIKVLGVATCGSEGVEVVKRTHPALVCLDVDMPGMTGIEALPLIMAASPQTRAIMITGNATRSIVEAAVAGGAKGYFLKPIRPAKVEEFVKKLFRL